MMHLIVYYEENKSQKEKYLHFYYFMFTITEKKKYMNFALTR